jgi:MFS transporter, DHA2 family, multidrug resistance protein
VSSLAGTWNGAKVAAVDPYANRYFIAFTVTLAAVMELLDTSIVNVAIPHMMGTLGATIDQITWVSTGYIVANVIVLPLTGWLSALFGRRRYFAGSIAIFTIASLFCGNAHSLPMLVFWRIVQGLGGGALLSTAQATLYETFPPEEYGTAMAIFGMGVMVGPTLGPTLGGYLTDAFSWPWIFYINLPFGIAAFLLTLAFIRDSRHAAAPVGVDVPGLTLLVLGIGSLQTLLERGERLDWFSSREIVALAMVSGVSLGAFIWRELTTAHPVVDLSILKSRQFALGVSLAAVLGLCLYGPIFLLPVYLQTLQGFTANQTGLVILPGAIASAFTMAIAGRFGARMDGRRLVALGATLFAISMWRWSLFTLDSGGSDFFWPLVLRGVGIGLVFVPLTNLSLAELPMSKIAQGTGLNNLLRQLGGSVGIAITATLLTRFQVQIRSILGQNVNAYSQAAQQRVAALSSYLVSHGTPLALAQQKAVALLEAEVTRQAAMIAFERLFMLFGLAFLVVLPLVAFMKRARRAGGGGLAH